MTTLRDPFDVVHKKDIKNKSGQVVAQVDYVGWSQVANRLDEVALGGWTFQIMGLGEDWCHGRLTILDQSYENIGYAENADMDWKKEPLKDAVSDAFKRCAALAGVARYLYDKDTPTTQGRGSSPRPVPSPAVRAAPPAAPAGEPIPPWDDTGTPDDEFRWSAPKAVDASTTCEEHGVEWRGEFGDRFHKLDGGGYCRRAPGNQPKARRAS